MLNISEGVMGKLDNFRGSEGVGGSKLYLTREAVLPQRHMISSADQQVLAPEQSVRQFATQAENLTKFNLKPLTIAEVRLG